jgi:hypothetical protein
MRIAVSTDLGCYDVTAFPVAAAHEQQFLWLDSPRPPTCSLSGQHRRYEAAVSDASFLLSASHTRLISAEQESQSFAVSSARCKRHR